ncbi:MAG: hypothetical protein N2B06_07625 [Clostridium sp.]
MKYNAQNVERLVIKSSFDNPLLWSNVKPWWFDNPIASDISWKVKGYKATHGYDPDFETVLTLLDYNKCKCDEDHVRLWLDVKQVSSEDRSILISLFRAQAMLFEIILKHFGKKEIPHKTLLELRALVPHFKKHLENCYYNVDELKKILNVINKYYDKLK